MMAQCTAHAQLKSVYGVSRVTCRLEPGPPISMSKVRGPGVEAIPLNAFADMLASLHELCGLAHTAANLVVALDVHRDINNSLWPPNLIR